MDQLPIDQLKQLLIRAMRKPTDTKLEQPRNLLERQRYLFENVGSKLKSDVEFNFKNEAVTLHAIKCILCSASKVFEAMFYGPFAKGNEIKSDSVDIDDISSDTFRELLRFIYMDEVLLHNYNVCQVIYAAHKYQILSLERKCVEYMEENVNVTNAIVYYQQTNVLEVIDAHFHCRLLNFIDINMEEICTLDVLFDVDMKIFINLTKRDTMFVSEYALYNVALEWSRRACENQSIQPTASNRKDIFEGFKSIRFSLMTSWEFDQCSSSILALNLMTVEEIQKMKKYIKHEPRGCPRFSTIPRAERKIILYTATVNPTLTADSEREREIVFHVLRHISMSTVVTLHDCKIKLVQEPRRILYESEVNAVWHKFFKTTILKPNQKYVLKIDQRDRKHKMFNKANYILNNTEPFVFQTCATFIWSIAFT